MKALFTLANLLISFLCIFNGFSQSPFALKDEEIKVIIDAFTPLDDSLLMANKSFNEFSSLFNISKTKSIVAIGEATHGTDEIRKIQLIFAKGLVTNSDYKSIALGETPLLESYPLFDFAVNGNGNEGKISNMFQFDIGPLVSWLKNENSLKAFKEKVWLLGSGIDTPDKTIDFVDSHCKYYDLKESIVPILALKKVFGRQTITTKEQIDSLKSINYQLISILHTMIGKSDSLDFKIACMTRALDYLPIILPTINNSLVSFQKRDSIIYNNLKWMLETKGKTVIILAHNLHTNKKSISKELYTNSTKSFGEYLNEKYGQSYLSIGTEIKEGSFSNGTSRNEKIIEGKSKLGSIIGSKINDNFGYILFNQQLKGILSSLDLQITKGTFGSFTVDCNRLLGEAFDGIIYIRNSSPYTFFNKDDFCMLSINLNENQSNQIIKTGRMSISTSFDIKKSQKEDAVTYSIYLNDDDKKEIRHYVDPIKIGGEELVYNVPEKTKYLSLSIILRKIDFFSLEELVINNKKQNLNNITLYDWNKMGYKIDQRKNNLIITK